MPPLYTQAMEWFQALVVSQEITLDVSIFRLMITALLVGCVGLERQTNNQPAGLRTHILIGVGASLLMLLSIYVPQQYRDFPSGDPSRIAAQVVSGIGFLGGGAILKFGADIRGLTTAASIWTVAAIGLAVGAGLFGAATFSTVLVLFTLITLNQVERRFFPKQMMKTLTIYTINSTISVEDIRRAISKAEIKIRSIDVQHSMKTKRTRFTITVYVSQFFDFDPFYREMNKLNDVYKVTLEEVQ